MTEDLDGMRFNTAIAAMMEFTNHLTPAAGPAALGAGTVRAAAEPVRPAPGRGAVAALGHADTLAYEPWPTFDAALTQGGRDRGAGADQRQAAQQGHGARPTSTRQTLRATALADERIRGLLEGKQVRKVIVVPGKLVNIVIA